MEAKFRILAGLMFALLFGGGAVASGQAVSAGEFAVQSFRRLEWDMDARTYHSMLDQNGKKTALIKVVTSASDLDFDVGVMGIVAVKQEVGEVWLYVPAGVRKITVRHNDYGIIRDYMFPEEIESATTYEMVLRIPSPELPDLSAIQDSIALTMRRPRLSGLTVSGVFSYPDYSAGVAVDYVRRHWGGYLMAVSNSENPDSSYDCLSDGTTSDGYIWTSGLSRVSVRRLSAGVIFRPWRWLDFRAGAGYGFRTLLWEDTSSLWANVSDISVSGVVADAGLRFNVSHISLSVNVSTIAFRTCHLTVGVGYRFALP